MAVTIFTMTPGMRSMILARKRRKLAEGKSPLFGDDDKVVRCWQCKRELQDKRKVVSKLFGGSSKIHYCWPCARLLKII